MNTHTTTCENSFRQILWKFEENKNFTYVRFGDGDLFMIFDIYYMDNGEYASHPYTYPWLNKKDMPSLSIILNNFQNTVNIQPSSLLDLKYGIYNLRWSKDDKDIQMKDTQRPL